MQSTQASHLPLTGISGFTALLVIAALVACNASHAASNEAPAYTLVRCNATQDSFNAQFLGNRGEKRRITVDSHGVTLGGNVKGFAQLASVRELRAGPTLAVTYVSGESVSFGPLTAQCQQELGRVAQRLSLKLVSGNG